MKNIRSIVALFLLAVFLAGHAWANTSSIDPTVPAQNSPLSSAALRGNFGNAANDVNTLFGFDTLSANQIMGTINAGNAGGTKCSELLHRRFVLDFRDPASVAIASQASSARLPKA